MRPHVEYLLGQDAENTEYLRLAALWHLEEGRHEKGSECLVAAIRMDPEDASLWHLAAVLETRRHRFDVARQTIQRARELKPDDADIAHVYIILHSLERSGAKAALETVREHEDALKLEPENDELIASMGDVFLEELEMPQRAEDLYRQALAIEPRNRQHRKRLWRAMQARHLLFRTLRLPFSGLTQAVNFMRGLRMEPWRALWLVIGAKFVLGFLAWLVVSMAVFGLPTLMIEWLVLADIERASRAADKVGRWWLKFHHLPFLVRLTSCFALMAGFWWGLFAVFGTEPARGLAFIAWFFVIHLVVMTVCVAVRKVSVRFAA